ncbi:mucin-like protein [Phytophthora cinnamomi]|uniref:mucin-like protein n=1 Tax=Phytophthora cinnamomi TaxID=4785 RepID=UPI00355AA836|nr:mucin-like protein [Phytophthora cinnamomi]
MVYSGGVRSFVQAAAVCALALSALPSIQAKGATTPAPTQAQTTCGISDGDKQVGIQVINDNSCANGGLGCYNNHCRYCKVLDTPKSSHLDTCISHGVAFTTTSTVAVTRGPYPSCASGGLGCLSDVCRFCKLKTTPQSDPYMDCALVNGAPTATEGPPTTAIPGTEAPSVTSATADTEAPAATTATPGETETPVSTDAPTEAPTSSDAPTNTPVDTNAPTQAPGDAEVPTEAPAVTDAPTEAPTSSDAPTEAPVDTETPTETPGETDAPTEVPVTADAPAVTTVAPASTGAPVDTGAPTEAPVATDAPPAPATTCTLVASAEDASQGISVGTDPSCSSGGVGCIDEICRFCKVTTSLQSAPYIDCAQLENGSSKSEAPGVSDTVPPSDAPAVTPNATTETPTATTETPEAPTEAPSTVATDAPDTSTETPATGTDGPNATTEAPATDAPNATTETPATATDAPNVATEAPTATETPVIPTDAPVSTAAALPDQQTCGIEAAAGDIAVGVHITTDLTCSTGGVGCINDLCRFCKVKTTPQSKAFVDCNSLGGATSGSAAPVDTTTTPPVATTNGTCALVASSGDASVGIRIVTDSACSAGGVGCINDVCRFCKVITSVQSAAFIDCATVDGYTPATETPAATTTPDATTTSSASASTCTRVASGGDIAVGVDIATDTTCRSGGVGCIDDVCRFCQVTETAQSAAFINCTLLSGYTPRAETPASTVTTTVAPATAVSTNAPVSQPACGLVVSAGDAAVGISITGDATCASGGVGCIDSVCRFCKVTTTVQSAAFVDCTSIADFTLATNAPTVTSTMPPTASTTAAPAVSTPGGTCSLTVSEGDAAVGINIFADTSCQFGGVGCIDNVCRFCKTRTTGQSAAFVDCPVAITTNTPAATTAYSNSTLEPTTTDADAATPTDSSVSVDATETPVTTDVPTETPAGNAVTEGPVGTDSPTELPSVDTTIPATAAPGANSDASTDAPGVTTTATDATSDAPTDAPVVDTASPTPIDTSDMLTEAPTVTTEPPTKAPLPTADGIDDDWEGSDSKYADSDSTYDDSEESTEGK